MGARWRIVLCLVAFALVPAASARADTYCVNATGCDHPVAGNNFQTALDNAAAHAGEDTIRVGDDFYATSTGFTYNDPAPVHIQGTGGRDVGAGGPLLVDSTSGPSGHTTLKVLGSNSSSIAGIDVRIPDGSHNQGIETNGAIDDVLVQNAPATATSPVGIVLDAGASLSNSSVDAGYLMNLSIAVILSGSATVSDSDLAGQFALNSFTPSTVAVIRRTHMRFTQEGVFAGNGVHMQVEDSLLESRDVAGTTAIAAEVSTDGVDSSLDLNHVTIAGSTREGSAALAARSQSGTHSRLTFRNGVIDNFTDAFFRVGNSGSADIATDWSNYGGGRATDFGPGTITETNHTDVAPGFLSATDYHLRPDSPLVDAGDPAEAGGLDGNGDCVARHDIGAFEFMPGPRAPRALAAAAPAQAVTGQSVSFDAAGSCDPDGDALTYDWTFDDGGGGPGATFGRTFSAPGVHFGTVTVTDSTGRSATATAKVLVTAPPVPLPAFNGVAIARQKLRASRKGVVKVKVKCPATAAGVCTGTLRLLGSRKAFGIAPGKTSAVAVKLSSSKLRTLRRKRTLKTTASAVARDASGSAKTTTARLTLLRPR